MTKNDMPVMRPLPIKTMGQSWHIQLCRWIFGIREWEIMQDWQFKLPHGIKITIPKGFVFDGASVPRALWGIMSPTGILFIPGLVHDFGYRNGFLWATSHTGHRYQYGKSITRKGYDYIFYLVCQQVNGMRLVSTVAYCMVSVFGWIAWNKNKKMRQQNGLV